MDDLNGKSVLDVKDINDLNIISKISGNDMLLVIKDGKAYRITVDTIVGYTAGNLNGVTPSEPSSSPSTQASVNQDRDIVFIENGKEIPVNKRAPGSFYLEERSQHSVRAQINLPISVTVSKQLGLKRV